MFPFEPLSKAPSPTPGTDTFVGGVEAAIELRAQQRAIMRILGRRGIPVTPEQIETIHACREPATLESWRDRAATADTAAAVLGD